MCERFSSVFGDDVFFLGIGDDVFFLRIGNDVFFLGIGEVQTTRAPNIDGFSRYCKVKKR